MKVISSIFGVWKQDIQTLVSSFKKKDWPFLITLLFFVIFFVFSLAFQSMSYVYNTALVILGFLSIFLAIYRQRLKIDAAVILIPLYVIVAFFVNITNDVFLLAPLANVLGILVIYEFVSVCDKREKYLLLRILYLALVLMLILSGIEFLPKWLVTRDVSAFYGGGFGNLDILSNNYTMIFAISIFYLMKKEILAIVPGVFSALLTIAGERRLSFLVLIMAVILLLYFVTRKKHRSVFIGSLIVFLFAFLIAVLVSSALQSVVERFIQSITDTFSSYTGKYDGELRVYIVARGLYYTFTNFFGGIGTDQIVFRYLSINAHDLIGDLSIPFGGLFAIVYWTFFTVAAAKLLRCKSDFAYIVIFGSLFFFLYLFTGTFLADRYSCAFAGFCAGLAAFSSKAPKAVRSYDRDLIRI